jgi:hypothetical protein
MVAVAKRERGSAIRLRVIEHLQAAVVDLHDRAAVPRAVDAELRSPHAPFLTGERRAGRAGAQVAAETQRLRVRRPRRGENTVVA